MKTFNSFPITPSSAPTTDYQVANRKFVTDGYQPLDADLSAIGALAGTSGFLKKTAVNTWTLDTSTYSLSTHSHNGTYQPLDADLTSIDGLTGTSGLLRKTAANTWSLDTTTYCTQPARIVRW